MVLITFKIKKTGRNFSLNLSKRLKDNLKQQKSIKLKKNSKFKLFKIFDKAFKNRSFLDNRKIKNFQNFGK